MLFTWEERQRIAEIPYGHKRQASGGALYGESPLARFLSDKAAETVADSAHRP